MQSLSTKLHGRRKQRVFFSIEKDLWLLREAILQNPYQLGRNQWQIVIRNLETSYEFKISARTARERIEVLIQKMDKGVLSMKNRFRVGTKMQVSERESLLFQVKALKGGGTPLVDYQANISSTATNHWQESNFKDSDYSLNDEYYSTSTAPAKKRTKSIEDELLIKKQELDYELEVQKAKYKHEERMKAMEIEEKRLDIENKNKEVLNSVLNALTELIKRQN